MTVIAVAAARDMTGVLAGRRNAVVAAATGACYLRMIDRVCGRPHIAVVTVFANVRGLNMGGMFASCLNAVVTTEAVPDDAGVIEVRRSPCHGRVTVITAIAAVDMCRMLARRHDSVMTGCAGTEYLCVIDDEHRREDIGAVAVFADIGCLNMCGILAGGFGAIVAVDTIPRNIDVIEVCGQPAGCRMTIVAGIAACNVVGILA